MVRVRPVGADACFSKSTSRPPGSLSSGGDASVASCGRSRSSPAPAPCCSTASPTSRPPQSSFGGWSRLAGWRTPARPRWSRSTSCFDGEDLAEVARRWDTDERGVVDRLVRHRAATSRSADSPRVGRTWPGSPRSSRCRAGRTPRRGYRPGRSGWPTGTPASIRPRLPAAGSWSGRSDAKLFDPDRDAAGPAHPGHPGPVRRDCRIMIEVIKAGSAHHRPGPRPPRLRPPRRRPVRCTRSARARRGQPAGGQRRRRRRPGDHAHRGEPALPGGHGGRGHRCARPGHRWTVQPVAFGTAIARTGRLAVGGRARRRPAYGPMWPSPAACGSRRCWAAGPPTHSPGSARRRCGPGSCCRSARRAFQGALFPLDEPVGRALDAPELTLRRSARPAARLVQRDRAGRLPRPRRTSCR